MLNVAVRNTHHQAITTRFLGPTNFRGQRVVASCEAAKATVAWDYSLDIADNHLAACRALATKLGWGGEWCGGGTASGYVFVCVGRVVSQ